MLVMGAAATDAAAVVASGSEIEGAGLLPAANRIRLAPEAGSDALVLVLHSSGLAKTRCLVYKDRASSPHYGGRGAGNCGESGRGSRNRRPWRTGESTEAEPLFQF